MTENGFVLAGYNVGDVKHSFTLASTENINKSYDFVDILAKGNTGIAGQWIFRIDKSFSSEIEEGIYCM